MRFEIKKKEKEEKVEIHYTKDGYFDCFPLVNTDINITMAYLNLGVDSSNMHVKCLWGFSPRESWSEETLIVPDAKEGILKMVGEHAPGISVRIDKDEMWKSKYDKKTGWYCIGENQKNSEEQVVKIMQNMIVVIEGNGLLKAIWIRPIFD